MHKEDLLRQQEELQNEAHEVLEKMQLLPLLDKYGKPEVIGSVALGLMAWRDIDIEVATDIPNKEDLSTFIKELTLNTDYRVDFTIILNEKIIKPDLPKGTYLGIKYYDHLPPEEQSSRSEKVWKIDIWFLTQDNLQGSKKTAKIKSKLTEEKKEVILQIKDVLASNPQYRKTIKSFDIYTAVLDRGVKDLEGFKKYLQETGRGL